MLSQSFFVCKMHLNRNTACNWILNVTTNTVFHTRVSQIDPQKFANEIALNVIQGARRRGRVPQLITNVTFNGIAISIPDHDRPCYSSTHLTHTQKIYIENPLMNDRNCPFICHVWPCPVHLWIINRKMCAFPLPCMHSVRSKSFRNAFKLPVNVIWCAYL